MKSILLAILLVVSAVVANAQSQPQTLDEYCIATSQRVAELSPGWDKLDAIVPSLPSSEQPKMKAYLVQLRAGYARVKHDACFAPDIRSARRAVEAENAKMVQLTHETIAYAQHSLADSYRKTE